MNNLNTIWKSVAYCSFTSEVDLVNLHSSAAIRSSMTLTWVVSMTIIVGTLALSRTFVATYDGTNMEQFGKHSSHEVTTTYSQ